MLGLIIKVLLITTHGLLPSKWAIVSDEMLEFSYNIFFNSWPLSIFFGEIFNELLFYKMVSFWCFQKHENSNLTGSKLLNLGILKESY